SPDGVVVTNNHVVEGADRIQAQFSDGTKLTAKVLGTAPSSDIAVIKVDGDKLPTVKLGDSDAVQVGDDVVAIGNALALEGGLSVTRGIVSGLHREIGGLGDVIQTDAAINPGNSGGPLVDAQAHVIGINSAIRAADSGPNPTGGQSGSIGLGFAIPINQGKRVAEELINTGKATHPVIGVTLDMEFTGDGAKVGDKGADGGPAVIAGGPGAKAGIRPGDVITEVDGQSVHSGEELIVRIRAHRPGDRLDLGLTRGGKDLSMTLVLGSASGT
ncbi:MAG TPA: trypsin-like peptidase domain-containing protein, partial [Streptomyces sp.]